MGENNSGNVKAPHRVSENIAKPNVKVEATVNNRRIGDTATKKENVVWNPDEVKDFVVDKDEKRPRPDFEVALTDSGCIQTKSGNRRRVPWHEQS